MNSQINKTFTTRFWWIFGVIFLIVVGVGLSILISEMNNEESQRATATAPTCPTELKGILTHSLIDMSKISHIIPLGNVSPPQHTSPVDHVYFSTETTEKIALYAPADSKITEIIAHSVYAGAQVDYVVQYTICNGLVLDFAGYTELIQPLIDIINDTEPTFCTGELDKQSEQGAEQLCTYTLEYQVRSGELIGYTQGSIGKDSVAVKLPFEIWASNYNIAAPADVDWSYYDDSRYPHTFCTFDLYSDELKSQFLSKIGRVLTQQNEMKEKDITANDSTSNEKIFQARTIEPVCGIINQNLTGTIQGMWYGEGWKNKEKNIDDPAQFAFIHWNIDPTYGEISNAGEITQGQHGVVTFVPQHDGIIDREPSEVTADGQVYCYHYAQEQEGTSPVSGKILTQLIDNHHMKLEYQSGICTGNETFTKPFLYER